MQLSKSCSSTAGGERRLARVDDLARGAAGGLGAISSRHVRGRATAHHVRGPLPAGSDDSIDAHLSPEELLAMFGDAGIVLEAQPRVFESVIPLDRRRHLSQPGGVPAPDALWTDNGGRTLVEVTGDDIAIEVAQLLLTRSDILVDVSVRLGCACAGAQRAGNGDARARVVSIEPPRAASAVVDHGRKIDLELPIPAVPRTASDAVHGALDTRVPVPAPVNVSVAHALSPIPIAVSTAGAESLGRVTPPRGTPGLPGVPGALGVLGVTEPRPKHGPSGGRPLVGSAPVAKDGVGRQLPRTYVARRRSSPRGIVRAEIPEMTSVTEERRAPLGGASLRAAPTPTPSPDGIPSLATTSAPAHARAPAQPPALGVSSWSRRRMFVVAGVVALLLFLLAMAGAMVGRALAR